MTTANKITIFRILLVPFFIVQVIDYGRTGNEWYRLAALLAFALAAISDGLDGYLARRYNQKSELGAILDPLADKALLISGVILLCREHNPYFQRIPLWVATIILSRDMLLLLGLGIIYYTFGKIAVRPRFSGKVATVFQMAMVLWTLFQWKGAFLPFLTRGSAFFTALSGAFYVWDGMRQLGTSPASSALPSNPAPTPQIEDESLKNAPLNRGNAGLTERGQTPIRPAVDR